MFKRVTRLGFVCFVLFVAHAGKAQHALLLPESINPTFVCDFRITESFLFENGSGAVFEPYDSILYKYDEWIRPERIERYLNDSLIGESKLEYDRVNHFTRVTSLLMDTFYVYNDCGLITEKNISTGSSDRSKASFRYQYFYDNTNHLVRRVLWDLKSFDEDIIIEEIIFSRNQNNQPDTVTTAIWQNGTQLYQTYRKTIQYDKTDYHQTEQSYSGNAVLPDSTTIIYYDEMGKVIERVVLVSGEGNFDTLQTRQYCYDLNNRMLTIVESNFNEGLLLYGQFWQYDYDVKGNLKFITRSETNDGQTWNKKDRVRFVVRGQYVPMASINPIEVVPNPVNCCADIIMYSDEYDVAQIMISDITGKIVHTQVTHLTPGRNLIAVELEKFEGAPIINRQIYIVAITGQTTFSRTTFIKL